MAKRGGVSDGMSRPNCFERDDHLFGERLSVSDYFLQAGLSEQLWTSVRFVDDHARLESALKGATAVFRRGAWLQS
jgi:hypothetical protein